MKIARIAIVLASLTLSLASKAQPITATVSDPSSMLGPIAAARGGATVASEATSEAVFQNPASAAFQKKYSVGIAYLGAGDALAASIVDTKSGPIGGGVYYLKRDLKSSYARNPTLGNYARTEERAGVSAMGRLSEQLGIGTIVKWAYRRSYDPRVDNMKSINFDVGARYIFSPSVAIGFMGENLLTDDTGLSPKQFLAGFEWLALAQLMLTAQVTKTSKPETDTKMILPLADKTVGFGAGVQYFFDTLILRAGYSQRSAWDQDFMSAGFGYDSKTFSLDYSFEAALRNDKITIHRVSVTAYF